jgi:hypothetical protein
LEKDAIIIPNPVFENAIVKIQTNKENSLSTSEKRAVKRFKISQEEVIIITNNNEQMVMNYLTYKKY